MIVKNLIILLILFVLYLPVSPENYTSDITANTILEIKTRTPGELYINGELVKNLEENEIYLDDTIVPGIKYDIKMVYQYSTGRGKTRTVMDSQIIIPNQYRKYQIEFLTNQKDLELLCWKRFFFEILTGMGPSYALTMLTNSIYGTTENVVMTNLCLTFGFKAALTRNFGIGFGYSGNISIPDLLFSPGGAPLLSFMFGDLYQNNIAFLFDVGIGALFEYKLGIYVKGFTFKFSHNLALTSLLFGTLSGVHNFSFEFGYTISWASVRKNFSDHTYKIIKNDSF